MTSSASVSPIVIALYNKQIFIKQTNRVQMYLLNLQQTTIKQKSA